MADLEIMLNDFGFIIPITVINKSTGAALDLGALGITTATMTVKTQDYSTTVLSAKSLGIVSNTIAPQLQWSVLSSDWNAWTSAGAYYAAIKLTGSGLVKHTQQFDIRVSVLV